jgi:carbon monoxide dehydrogenase subunit G
MKISNQHERVLEATPEQVAALIADFDQVWPTHVAPAPLRRGARLLEAGVMLWEEVDRAGAVRAFRVVSPQELQAEHWFEVEPANGGTLLRHTVAGEALREYEEVWREQINPVHDRVLEALFDNIEAAIQTA